jgi:putative glycosyltransferase (TIGR04348 family)
MRVLVVSPAPPSSSLGNAVTADRYAEHLRGLGLEVCIRGAYDGMEAADVLIALHACKSAASVLRFARQRPDRPIVVVLTGTDIYRDIARSQTAQRALREADVLVTLQRCALDRLAPALRAKAVVIEQSAPTLVHERSDFAGLSISVIGHLRYEKDPLRAGYALKRIPSHEVNIRVTQAGAALQPYLGTAARRIAQREPRYRYLGELTRADAQRLLACSDALVISSRMEGGANIVSAAIAARTPVLASHIPGNIGLLGADYPGYFPVGNTQALAHLLVRAATDAHWLQRLRAACDRRRPLVEPERERALWANLIRRVARAE